MAIRWKLSIMGLYKYDGSIFDNFKIPEGMDRQPVIDAICIRTAGLATIYTSPESLAHSLAVFSEERFPAWTRAYKALTAEYNILDTVNTSETETRTPDLTKEVNTTRTPDLTATGENSGSDSTTEQVTAFNGNSLADRSKTITDLGTTNTVRTTGTEKTESSEKESGSDTTERIRSGYTGPAQDRVSAELELCQASIIDMIVQDVKCNFCVMVY